MRVTSPVSQNHQPQFSRAARADKTDKSWLRRYQETAIKVANPDISDDDLTWLLDEFKAELKDNIVRATGFGAIGATAGWLGGKMTQMLTSVSAQPMSGTSQQLLKRGPKSMALLMGFAMSMFGLISHGFGLARKIMAERPHLIKNSPEYKAAPQWYRNLIFGKPQS